MKNDFLTSDKIYQYYMRDFSPALITATILAPLNRLKILQQTMPLISISELDKPKRYLYLIKKLIQDQGLFSLYRGNLANSYKLFMQSTTNLFIINRLFNNPNGNYSSAVLSAIISSTLIYPFDLAMTRMSSDMTRFGHKRIYGSVLEVFTRALNEEESKVNDLNMFNSFRLEIC